MPVNRQQISARQGTGGGADTRNGWDRQVSELITVETIAEVPPADITVTSTVPAAGRGGERKCSIRSGRVERSVCKTGDRRRAEIDRYGIGQVNAANHQRRAATQWGIGRSAVEIDENGRMK